ncbi:MAG: HEAT repeat domain-containing protein [Bacillota bacterium]
MEPFCRQWLQASDPDDQDLGIGLAGRLDLCQLVPRLGNVFETSRDPAVRARVIHAWPQMSSPEALECLRLAARSLDYPTARRAQEALDARAEASG